MKFLLFVLHWTLVGLGAGVLAGVIWAAAFSSDGLTFPAGIFKHESIGYAAAVSRAAPGVVSIHALSQTVTRPNPLTDDPLFRQFFGPEKDPTLAGQTANLGSGVILDPSGVVLTNYHVIRGSDAIHIELADGRIADARIVGTDPDTDLAVLKIDLANLPSISVVDSDSLKVGDVVLAIGNALGIGQTVTQGIVSATGRNRIGINTFENFIQTDAAINFGNSGGALVNARGELVGINSVRIESEGIGFAIPTSIALRVARQILTSGSVERGWIGIDARDLSDSLKRMLGVDYGIVVLGLLKGGPADLAGVRIGDVFTHLGDHDITDSRTAIERITAFKPGSRITLRGVRKGQPYSTIMTVSRRPPPLE